MSAFLGPIHHWLYHKILLQEKIVEAILELNQEKGYVQGLENAVIAHCGMIGGEPLENCIDTSNIHGWLQEKVDIVENRLSYVVTAITKEDDDRMADILKTVYRLGQKCNGTQLEGKELNSAEQVYQLLQDLLLDGMPCDRVNQLISSNAEEVIYKRTRCIHEVYWLEQGGLVLFYYEIRKKFVEGFLAHTSFVYCAEEDGNYHIRRRSVCLE